MKTLFITYFPQRYKKLHKSAAANLFVLLAKNVTPDAGWWDFLYNTYPLRH
jgi:hypothetical protein